MTISKADIVDLIAQIQGYRQREARGPAFMAEAIYLLKIASTRPVQSHRQYYVQEAFKAWRFDIAGGRV